MASGIYKRTMIRSPSAAANGGNPSPDGCPTLYPSTAAAAPEPEPEPEPEPDNADHRAPPPGGSRNLYYATEHRFARRTRSHSKTKTLGLLYLTVGLLTLGLIAVSMAWLLVWTRLDDAEAEKLAMDANLRRISVDLQQTRARLEQRENELSALVEARIPGLAELVLNQLIGIDDRYVQNVTFFESGVADAKAIEYSVMLKNATEGMILPEVEIFLFDELGRQVGLAKLKKGDAITSAHLEELAPGESRSYHARIEVERGAVAKFYLIHIR